MHTDLPDTGSVTERGRLLSPTRIAAACPWGVCCAAETTAMSPDFRLNRGNPTRLPLRFPERESDHAASPLPQVDRGFLEHLLTHLPRHASPVTASRRYPRCRR